MAKINSVSVGRAAKKLGNMVYYTMNGKTYARARVEQVKNPKTAKQMAQRLIFTTAVRSRDALKSIVDHSFENKKYGSESLNYFMKRNLEILRARAAADNGLTGSFNVPYGITMQANPLLVSQGTIPSMSYSFGQNGLTFSVGIDNVVDVATFLAEHPEIKKGDQITVLLLVPNVNVEEAVTAGGEVVNPTSLSKMRITIPANIDDDAIFFDATSNTLGSLLIVEGVEHFSIRKDSTYLTFVSSVTNRTGVCGCIIVSRPEGNKWLRSTEYMKMNPNYDDGLYNFNDVLNTWMQGTTEIEGLEDNEYLNQGQEATIANSYSLQSRSFNMTNAATSELSSVSLAALDTNTSNGSRITQIIYTQTTQQAAAGKITCYTVQSANVLVPNTTEFNKPSNAAALITFDDANKLLGGILSIKQVWRGKTNTTTAEYELQQETGVDDYVRHITGYQGPGSFEMPALLVAIGTDNKAHFVVNDGNAVADDGTPAEYGVAYGTGSMGYSPLDDWRLSELKNYCSVIGNDSGTEFAIGDEITLETYNRITQEFETLGYVW